MSGSGTTSTNSVSFLHRQRGQTISEQEGHPFGSASTGFTGSTRQIMTVIFRPLTD